MESKLDKSIGCSFEIHGESCFLAANCADLDRKTTWNQKQINLANLYNWGKRGEIHSGPRTHARVWLKHPSPSFAGNR
jgi:hypothetical protein